MSAPKHDIPPGLSRSLESSGTKTTGHREINHATQYRLARGSQTANLNVYHTGKISVDGKDSDLKRLLEAWRLSKEPTRRKKGASKGRTKGGINNTSKRPLANSKPRVGTDEAGKGEYFGPLVVAGVRVLNEARDRELREAGVRDSKDLNTTQARSIAARVEEIVGPENLRVLALEPSEYERRREAADRNVNRLLGELNVEIIDELKAEVEVAVVDEFGKKARSYIGPHMPEGIELDVRPRAEDDTAVAAASILARARYLEEMDRLSEEVGVRLPRGSTHVEAAARRVVDESGEEGLRRVAKTHFSITEKVLKGRG
ncbi:MAG: ribonuclease HIII [Rubrobacteraceae bacterium]